MSTDPPETSRRQTPDVPPDDIVFMKVRDALAKGGCPVCRLASEGAQRFLWGFLYEQVNDPQTRQELLASRGFCARHAWALGQFHDALGVTIVYRHLVQELAGDIKRAAGASQRGSRQRVRDVISRLRAALRPKQECPACRSIRNIEESALSGLLRRLNDPEVFERLSGASALCLPHFLAGVSLARDTGRVHRLVQAQVAMLEKLEGYLDEFIRRHDYRFSNEPLTPEEETAWMRAIEALVGRDPFEDRTRRLGR